MNKFRILICLLLFVVASRMTSFAQEEKYKNAVKVTTAHKIPPKLKVGDEITLVFNAKIAETFHMYAAKMPEKKNPKKQQPQSTSLDLSPSSTGFELVGGLQDGAGVITEFDDVFRNDVSFYHHNATFTQKIRITSDKPIIEGKLNYQVCDENMCVFDNYPFKSPALKVEKAETPKTPEEVKKAEELKKAEEAKKAEDAKKMKADSQANVRETAEAEVPLSNHVVWEMVLSPDAKPKKGDIITVTFKAKIDKGYHIYSAIPPKIAANTPTTFDLDALENKDLQEEGDLAEAGKRITEFDKVFKTEVSYFKDSVTFSQKLKVTGDNPAIKAYLNYQICDSIRCINSKQVFDKKWEVAATPANGEVTGTCEDANWLKLFLMSFLLGLGAVLTPCVFPMIPMTVSFFTKKSETRARGIFNAVFYGFSIIFIYTVLGLAVSVISGKGDLLQVMAINPWVNLAYFILLFVFALSFLGWFEITLPSSWGTATRSTSQKSGATSIIGVFLMALTLVIVSFSCTGPLVGTAMASAAKGACYINPIIAMLGFSSAIALPFTVFAFFPNLLTNLKSGSWLNSVKVVLGFIELALALTYLSSFDLPLQLHILPREVFLGLWIAIFGALAMYLFGKLQLPHDSPTENIGVPRLLLALMSLAFTIYLVPGMFGAKMPLVEGILPDYNSFTFKGAKATSSTEGTSESGICNYPNKKYDYLNEHSAEASVCAFYDVDQAMEYAKKNNKPLFLDFTGFTCKNCRKVEQNIWIDAEINKMLNEDFVLVSLYTDDTKALSTPEKNSKGEMMTTVGEKWRDYQVINYGLNAQPYYVIIDHNKEKLVQPFDYQSAGQDVNTYKKLMKDALAEFQKRSGK